MKQMSRTLKSILVILGAIVLVVIAAIAIRNSAPVQTPEPEIQNPGPADSQNPGTATAQPSTPSAAQINSSILGSYTLVSFDGTSVEGSGYTLSIEEDRLGATFCNSMGGEYTLKNNTLRAQLVSTLMFCTSPEGLMDMESAFGAMMDSGARITPSDDSLILTGGGHTFIYR